MGQGAGDGGALVLAHGELGRLLAQQVSDLELLDDGVQVRVPLRQAQQAAVDGDVARHAEVGQQAAGLEHEADGGGTGVGQVRVPALLPQAGNVFGYPIREESELPGGERAHHESQQLQGRALAAAALAGQGDHLPGAQGKARDLHPERLVAAAAGEAQVGAVQEQVHLLVGVDSAAAIRVSAHGRSFSGMG